MSLQLSLHPHEKIVLNGAMMINGNNDANLVLQNKACVLRENDIMQAGEADTTARRIYFAIFMMYIDRENREDYYANFALRMTEFMSAANDHDALLICLDISREVKAHGYYRALVLCRKLFGFDHEQPDCDVSGAKKRATNC